LRRSHHWAAFRPAKPSLGDASLGEPIGPWSDMVDFFFAVIALSLAIGSIAAG
jgi:hypothetical protein